MLWFFTGRQAPLPSRRKVWNPWPSWGPAEGVLGGSWRLLGALLKPFEGFRVLLGSFLETSEGFLEAFWGPLRNFRSLLTASWGPHVGASGRFGALWGRTQATLKPQRPIVNETASRRKSLNFQWFLMHFGCPGPRGGTLGELVGLLRRPRNCL